MVAEITSISEINQRSGINKELADEFKTILANKLIFTKFQPIVCLATGDIVGYEALSRGPEASIFENPTYLFEIAEKLTLLEDLDMVCREKSIFNASKLALDTKSIKLFINIDAGCLTHPRHNKGETLSLIEKYGFEINNIVLEITERAFIKDPKVFYEALDHYKSQGFSIAIDDLGSGSAGLRLISETNPHIVKIDKFLIENVDKSSKKQAILKMILEMCHKVFNSKVVAEGIETPEELTTVRELGIDWGQGYFLGKPSTILQPVPDIAKNKISIDHQREEIFLDETKIGSIASFDLPVFHSGTLVCELVKMFNEKDDILAAPIVDDGSPVGLVMRLELFSKLSKKFGFALFYNRPVSHVMDTDFLAVDFNQCVDTVAEQVLARNVSRLYDALIIIKNNKYYGISTVHALLEKMTALKIRYASQSNPLTGLPGNISIRTFFEKQIKTNQDFACVYFDLDNFKAYNDYYGFCKGDEIIKRTAYLIMEVFKSSRIGYIGHIGGDDFIAVIHAEEIQGLCTRFIREFDAMVPTFYAEDDMKNGCIETLDRKNEKCKFPFMSISLAVVTSHENSR
ncbi:MAG TPA: GGDEF domain-containing protein, partial [Candidatus Wunengus sp. YC60]|uniref:GGDEF domain-containing protein n=1 Tax=Candidatus Wunengus sp. YC60 TaxID=3367697 RepID=UPI0040251446